MIALRRDGWKSLPVSLAIVLTLVPTAGCAPDVNPENTEKTEDPAPAANAEPAPDPEVELAPLRAAVQRDPSDVEARRALARALRDANFMEDAVTEFERVLQADPGFLSLTDLAFAYTSAARFDEAIAIYERVLEQRPNDPIALHNLGNIHRRRGEFDLAVTYFEKALAERPGYLLAQSHLAETLKAQERYREAYRGYEAVLKLEPSTGQEAELYVDALYQLASLDLMMGAYERAGQFLTEVIRVDPKHEAAYYAYGQLLVRLGRPEEAQQAFDMHLKLLAERQPKGPAGMAEE